MSDILTTDPGRLLVVSHLALPHRQLASLGLNLGTMVILPRKMLCQHALQVYYRQARASMWEKAQYQRDLLMAERVNSTALPQAVD